MKECALSTSTLVEMTDSRNDQVKRSSLTNISASTISNIFDIRDEDDRDQIEKVTVDAQKTDLKCHLWEYVQTLDRATLKNKQNKKQMSSSSSFNKALSQIALPLHSKSLAYVKDSFFAKKLMKLKGKLKQTSDANETKTAGSLRENLEKSGDNEFNERRANCCLCNRAPNLAGNEQRTRINEKLKSKLVRSKSDESLHSNYSVQSCCSLCCNEVANSYQDCKYCQEMIDQEKAQCVQRGRNLVNRYPNTKRLCVLCEYQKIEYN